MNRSDSTTRQVTTGIVLAVGLFAAGDSYSHIYSLARTNGQDIASAALLPLAGDGLVIAASAVMLVASRTPGGTVPLRARLLMLAGVGATIAANVAYGLPGGLTDALLSIWAVLAYVGCMELLAWMRQHTGMQRKAGASARTAPDASADAPQDAPGATVTSIRRQPAADLMKRAEEAFPEGGRLPTLRDIQAALKVGQPKAQLVQRHLTGLRTAG